MSTITRRREAGGVVALLTRGLWFRGDDWDHLLTRGTVPVEDKGLSAPHGANWSTAVVLVNRALFAVFGLRDYTPWALLTIAFHLGICVVLFTLLRRVARRPWLAAATTAEGMSMGAVGATGHDLFRPTSVSVVQGWTQSGRTIDAVWSKRVLEQDLADGAELGVTGPATTLTTLTTLTTEACRAGRSSGVREWTVKPGAFFIASTAKQAVVRVVFASSGRYVVCTP